MSAPDRIPPAPGYRRIATEEPSPRRRSLIRRNFSSQLLAPGGIDDAGFRSLCGFLRPELEPRALAVRERLQDLGERR